MDYSLLKKEVSLSETVFEGNCEQPIDLDFNLPDYCPDIQKILKCQVYPKIYTRNISGDRLDVDGCSVVKILYVDAVKKSVRCSEHTLPFTCSFNLKTTPQNAIVLTQTKPEYLNCRALSPRRLDIHGAFSITAKVICTSQEDVVFDIAEDDVQVKKEKYLVSEVTGCVQQFFTIDEDLEIKDNNAPLEALLRSDVCVFLTENKVINDKMMIKGEVALKMLYLSDLNTGSVDVLEYLVPISQIFDVDGLEENSLSNVKLDLLNYDIRVRNDLSDNNTVISLEAKLCVTADTYCNREVEVITDAYSTKYDIDLVYGQKTLSNLHMLITDSCLAKDTIEVSSAGIMKVLDLWSEQCVCKAVVENGQIAIAGKVNICVLALDQEETPFYTERTVDFNYPIATDADITKLAVHPLSQVSSISYRLNGASSVEVRCDIKITSPVFENQTVRAIVEASANEEHLRKKDNSVALTLYYTDENENVWNIARNYCVCCENIKMENDLIDDIIPNGKMILIPNI